MSELSSENGLSYRRSRMSSRMLSTADLMNSDRGAEVRESVSDWAVADKKKTFSRLVVEYFLMKVSRVIEIHVRLCCRSNELRAVKWKNAFYN